jgi:biotin synthase
VDAVHRRVETGRLRVFWDMNLADLVHQAHRTKIRGRGDRLSLCTIMNVRSGKCTEDCAFCAQSARYKTESPVFPLKSVEEIVGQAALAKAAGATRFSLVASGRGLRPGEAEPVAQRIHAIRTQVGISVCASFGIADRESLSVLKSAGLSRYHHNIETSERYFPQIVTTHGFGDRLATIRAAQDAGLEVCSGGIIGIGETEEDRLDMASTLSSLEVDSVPINILMPIAGTPLATARPISVPDILRTIAVFRMAFPDKAVRIAGGRDTALADFQGLAFWAGADAMLIGGYLTQRGRAVDVDQRLAVEMKRLWQEELVDTIGQGTPFI